MCYVSQPWLHAELSQLLLVLLKPLWHLIQNGFTGEAKVGKIRKIGFFLAFSSF